MVQHKRPSLFTLIVCVLMAVGATIAASTGHWDRAAAEFAGACFFLLIDDALKRRGK